VRAEHAAAAEHEGRPFIHPFTILAGVTPTIHLTVPFSTPKIAVIMSWPS
jgi:hypothetical protein